MSKQITAMEDCQKENERLREENTALNDHLRLWETSMMEAIGEDGVGSVSQAIAALKNSPTPEDLDKASIANEAKNQRIRELEGSLNEMIVAARISWLPFSADTMDCVKKAKQLLNQKQ